MKSAKFLALRMMKIPPEWGHRLKSTFWTAFAASTLITSWGGIMLSPWWYPRYTSAQVTKAGFAVWAALFTLFPIVQWAVRRVNRPTRRKVTIKYDPRGGRCDKERLGYVSAETICEIGRGCTK